MMAAIGCCGGPRPILRSHFHAPYSIRRRFRFCRANSGRIKPRRRSRHLLLARRRLGLAGPLPVSDLRTMLGERIRHPLVLRHQPELRLCGPAPRLLARLPRLLARVLMPSHCAGISAGKARGGPARAVVMLGSTQPLGSSLRGPLPPQWQSWRAATQHKKPGGCPPPGFVFRKSRD